MSLSILSLFLKGERKIYHSNLRLSTGGHHLSVPSQTVSNHCWKWNAFNDVTMLCLILRYSSGQIWPDFTCESSKNMMSAILLAWNVKNLMHIKLKWKYLYFCFNFCTVDGNYCTQSVFQVKTDTFLLKKSPQQKTNFSHSLNNSNHESLGTFIIMVILITIRDVIMVKKTVNFSKL